MNPIKAHPRTDTPAVPAVLKRHVGYTHSKNHTYYTLEFRCPWGCRKRHVHGGGEPGAEFRLGEMTHRFSHCHQPNAPRNGYYLLVVDKLPKTATELPDPAPQSSLELAP